MNVLVTCPPMLRNFERFRAAFLRRGLTPTTPDVTQTLSEEELVSLVPPFDGWIIGDDPASARVLAAGRSGRLRAAVKWGVGIDNVDTAACQRLGIRFAHTPGMFGREVADMALGYVIALARHTFEVHQGILAGCWPKPTGVSLAGKTAAVVGLGDIGRHTVQRLLALEMKVIGYDVREVGLSPGAEFTTCRWPERLHLADFLVFTCALTESSRHMLNADTVGLLKDGVRIVNVARGPLIQESALVRALRSGKVHSAALDVFESEPLPPDSPLREFKQCVFGSHNSSNTVEAVVRTSERALELMAGFLGGRAHG